MTVVCAVPGVHQLSLATGISASCTVEGEGEPLLMLGGPHTAEMMRNSMGGFLRGQGFQVITAEYRGIAPSSSPLGNYRVEELAEDAIALIDALGLSGRCLVYGYSLGSLVLQEVLVRWPGTVSRAVLAGTRLLPGVVYRTMHEEFLQRAAAGEELNARSEILLRSLMMFGPRRLANDVFVDSVQQLLTAPPVAGYNAAGLTHASLTYEPDASRLAAVTTPCLVIGLGHDILTPAARAKAVAEAMACDYVELPLTGHGVFMERPQELCRLVGAFLAGAPVTQRRGKRR